MVVQETHEILRAGEFKKPNMLLSFCPNLRLELDLVEQPSLDEVASMHQLGIKRAATAERRCSIARATRFAMQLFLDV